MVSRPALEVLDSRACLGNRISLRGSFLGRFHAATGSPSLLTEMRYFRRFGESAGSSCWRLIPDC